jgi:hypothetical protein
MKARGVLILWLLFIASALLAGALAVWLVMVGLPFKRLYADTKNQQDQLCRVLSLDQLSGVRLPEVLVQWTCRFEDTNHVTTAVSLMGQTPSVQNWIQLCNTPMADFSWWDLTRTRKSFVFATVKRGILELSNDRTFYVSDDRSIALLWSEPLRAVYLFQDQSNAVRLALYSNSAKTIEPDTSANAAHPGRFE